MNEGAMLDELERVNQQYVDEYGPAIVIVILVLIIGLTGNTLASVYYGWKAQKCVAQYLIFWLSVNDAVTNVVLVDDVVDFLNTVKYRNVAACKLFWVLKHWLIANSLLFMVAVAIERYRHVCFPFAKQCTLPAARVMIVVLVVFSLMISVRYFATADVVRINITTNVNSTKGFYCSVSVDPEMENIEGVFHYIDICVHVTIIITLVVLYAQIVRKVIQSQKSVKSHEQQSFIYYKKKHISRQHTLESSCSTDVVEIQLEQPKGHKPLKQQNTLDSTCSSEDTDLEEKSKGRNLLKRQEKFNSDDERQVDYQADKKKQLQSMNGGNNSAESSPIPSQSTITRRNQISQMLKRMTLKPSLSVSVKTELKITIMVTVITVVSMACFVPYYLAMLLMTINISGDGLILSLGQVIWRRTFMLNSAVNPFIMFIFNESFRRFLVLTFKCKRFSEQ